MAEQSEDGQEKTEEPTARKLEKAAEEGQVLSSKERVEDKFNCSLSLI